MSRPRLASLVLTALLAALPAGAETVRVSAAASLIEGFREIAAAFEKVNPGDEVELNFGGSQVLRTQIEHGARVDVFASADVEHALALERSGLLGPSRVFARNRLVVAVPRGSRITRLGDLARPGAKIVLAAPAVPAGRYTLQALRGLNAATVFGDDFESRVRANVVSEESSVRAVLAKVTLGEADAGFVYATDAASAGEKVRAIDIPAPYDVIAEYPIGVVTKSTFPARARAFVYFVMGAEGQAILRRHGFAP